MNTNTIIKIKIIIFFLFFLPHLYSQSTNQNYIISKTILNDQSTLSMDKIEYFDGIGRLSQTVQKKITSSGKDLILNNEYDNIGRIANVWLPVPYSGNGSYLENASLISVSQSTYGSSEIPYSKSIYESSPLDRVVQQYGPGVDWYSNGKAISTAHLTNQSSGVLSCAWYIVTSSGMLQKKGLYPSAKLYITKTNDEDGKTSYQFIDFLGRVILSRQTSELGMNDTYYVYDDLNNLRYVLPPLASDALSLNGGVWDASNQALKDYAFVYQYDERNRNIEKKLPGVDPIYMVYDRSDRLVLIQDGNQRLKNVWTVNKYDKHGRNIYASEVLEPTSFSKLLEWFKDWLVVEEFGTPVPYYPMEDTGYTRGFYITQPTRLLSVNYYDSYEFMKMLPESIKNELIFVQQSGFENQHTNSKGLLTGSRIYDVNDSTKYIATSYYYDKKGRMIQKRSTTHMGGYIFEDFLYTYTGKILSQKRTHKLNGISNIEIYNYTYDHAERLTKLTHKFNNFNEVTIKELVYDDLGRVKTKKIHGGIEYITYMYNIRNSLTTIGSPRFSQNIYYNTGLGSLAYNGNISSMSWRSGGETTLRGYKFSYDGLNRLIKADYAEDGSFSTNLGRYTEQLSYDKHGNVLTLKRFGKQNSGYGLIDDLSLTYSGNQIKTVSDSATDPIYQGAFNFVNGATTSKEYFYDNSGNMTIDYNKKIAKIQCNRLNLPEKIQFSFGNTINYQYGADGKKRSVTYITSTTNLLVPMGTILPIPPNQVASTIRTDYCENFVYENMVLNKILIDDGYVTLSGSTPAYHYYLKDYLGNNRVVISQTGTVEQVNHYYPFGGLFGEGIASSNQPYKYNGKELDRMHGLDLYDYGARHYDAALPTWFSVDPMAEKYYSISPYVYCANNPVKYIDPNGKEIVIGSFVGRILGYLGINTYEAKVQHDIAQLKSLSPDLNKSIEKMEQSSNTIKIVPIPSHSSNKGNKTALDKREKGSSIIYYDPDNYYTNIKSYREPIIGLAHELGHAEDILNNKNVTYDKQKAKDGDRTEANKGNLNEKNAINKENIVRDKLKREKREYDYYK